MADVIGAGANEGGAGTLQIFDGTVPSDLTSASPNPPLVTITLPNPAYAAAIDDAQGGRINMNALPQNVAATAAHDGNGATHYRVFGGDAAAKHQGTVGTSGAELNLNDINIVVGALISITGLAVIQPPG
jgi:hypothetical protein